MLPRLHVLLAVSQGLFKVGNIRWKIVPLAPGFSGGPVFAMVRNAYLEYPALVGVCLGVVSGLDFDDTNKVRSVTEAVQSAYGIVTPLDKMFGYRTPEK